MEVSYRVRAYITLGLTVPTLGLLLYIALISLYVHFEFTITNETDYSSRFSWSRWGDVSVGMAQDEVVTLLGAPLREEASWGCGNKLWNDSRCVGQLWAIPRDGFGYYAQIDFIDGKVVRAGYWEDD
jgi:hypothetical protein